MTRTIPDLRELSRQLEEQTGADSIATVERIYLDGDGKRYECVYPDCGFVRYDPVAMWKHVHFSRKHGLSFGVDLQRLVADLLPREVTA